MKRKPREKTFREGAVWLFGDISVPVSYRQKQKHDRMPKLEQLWSGYAILTFSQMIEHYSLYQTDSYNSEALTCCLLRRGVTFTKSQGAAAEQEQRFSNLGPRDLALALDLAVKKIGKNDHISLKPSPFPNKMDNELMAKVLKKSY